MSSHEFSARLQHLVNVMQVVILNSSLSDFNDKPWVIAREYVNRIDADVRDGTKSWATMTPNLQSDAYLFAKDHTQSVKSAKPDKPEKPKKDDGRTVLTCKDYNSKSNCGENCSWELEESNVGKRCNRLHVCSYCAKSGAQRTHRAKFQKHNSLYDPGVRLNRAQAPRL